MYRILLIDDSRSDRELLLGNMPEAVFKEAEFIEAENLEAASKLLEYRAFDVAVLDLFGVAPGTGGLETFYLFRKLAPSTPTLILTSHEDERLAKLLVENGADGYVVKGAMTPQQLYRELFNVIMITRHRPRLQDAQELAKRVSSSSQELQRVRCDTTEGTLSQGVAVGNELNLLLLQKVTAMEAAGAGRDERMKALVSDVRELKDRAQTAENLMFKERESHIEFTHAERMQALSLQKDEAEQRRALQRESAKKRWQLIGKIATFALAPTSGFLYLLWHWWTTR